MPDDKKKEVVAVEPVEEQPVSLDDIENQDEPAVIDANIDDSDHEGDIVPGMGFENDVEEGVPEPDPVDPSTTEPDSADTEQSEETDEVDDLISKATRGQQKRIDKLTARNSEKESEIQGLKDQVAALTQKVDAPDKDSTYTYAQLDDAYDNAYKDGDTKLMAEIRKHERENIKKELRDEYTTAQKQNQTNNDHINNQWKQVHKTFVAYSDPEQTGEFYPGSHDELNIMSENSKLFQLAKANYTSNPDYQRSPNGLIQAVQDAFNAIIKVRTQKKAGNAETARLKNKVKKLNREKSQGSASGIKSQDTTPKKAKSPDEDLADFVAMRKRNSLGFVAQK